MTAAFHLALMELFHPYYLSNVKQGQIMHVNVKWNVCRLC